MQNQLCSCLEHYIMWAKTGYLIAWMSAADTFLKQFPEGWFSSETVVWIGGRPLTCGLRGRMSENRDKNGHQKFVTGFRPIVHARQALILGIRQPLDGPVFHKL